MKSFTAALLAVLPLLAIGLSTDEPATLAVGAPSFADDCACAVVNKVHVTTASGNCPIDGQGSVPCISIGAPTYPQGGTPQSGVCIFHPVCTGTGHCTYKTVSFSVTVASCAAASCGVASPAAWKIAYPNGHGTNDVTGTQALGTTATVNISPGSLSDACGTVESTVTLTFYKADSTTAFKVAIDFGCGQCDAAIPE